MTPNRQYPLYLPATMKWITLFALGFMTLMGPGIIFGIIREDPKNLAPLIFVVVWLGALGAFWHFILTLPTLIEVTAAGEIMFISRLRRTSLSPQDIQSIKPVSNQFGFFMVRHTRGKITILAHFDGFHRFLSELEKDNPALELRGC